MTLVNLLAFQLVWLSCVGAAGAGLWWPGLVPLALFATWELAHSEDMPADLALLGKVCALGIVADSTLALGGVLDYAAAVPADGIAPLWIVALWAAFALTLRRSLRWLAGRPLLSALLGAVFGPLSYWIAARTWQAVAFALPMPYALAMIALVWALALPLCMHWAVAANDERNARERTRHVTGGDAGNV